MKLTIKQQKFAELYATTGNATNSYMEAYGCNNVKVAETSSSRLLRNVKVMSYISELNNQASSNRIADMVEVKEFWTNTMRNKESEPKDRLKASEYIAKTNGAFIEKIESKEDKNINVTFNIPRPKEDD